MFFTFRDVYRYTDFVLRKSSKLLSLSKINGASCSCAKEKYSYVNFRVKKSRPLFESEHMRTFLDKMVSSNQTDYLV